MEVLSAEMWKLVARAVLGRMSGVRFWRFLASYVQVRLRGGTRMCSS